jgi:uncharacterized cupin superfamily protein
MELHPGVFVSSIATDEWEPDADPAGETHWLCRDGDVQAGLWRFTKGPQPVRWTLPDRETILVLEGAVTIEIADGPTLELTVGDMDSMPKGAQTTWHITTPYKEFWVIS